MWARSVSAYKGRNAERVEWKSCYFGTGKNLKALIHYVIDFLEVRMCGPGKAVWSSKQALRRWLMSLSAFKNCKSLAHFAFGASNNEWCRCEQQMWLHIEEVVLHAWHRKLLLCLSRRVLGFRPSKRLAPYSCKRVARTSACVITLLTSFEQEMWLPTKE